jgi:hypothetical protein
MSKKNFTAVREGNSLKVMCDGVEILDTTCDRFGIEFNTYDIALMTTKVDLSPKDVAEMMKVIRNVYDPGKKEIPPYKAPLFRNGEHVTHVKSGESYVVVGTPSDGYIIEETLEHAYCYKKLKPKNIAEMNRKWIRSQTKMEDGRFVSEGYEQRGGPCGEIPLPIYSPHTHSMITDCGMESLREAMKKIDQDTPMFVIDSYPFVSRQGGDHDGDSMLLKAPAEQKPKVEPSPLLKGMMANAGISKKPVTFDGVLTSNEIERAADKAIEMGYDGKDREIVFKAAHAVGLGSLIPSLLNGMGNAVPNVVSIQRAADRKLEERKTAQVSGVSAAATSSGDGGSIFGEVLGAVGDVAMGALDSVGDVCSGIGECVGEVLSGIGDGL